MMSAPDQALQMRLSYSRALPRDWQKTARIFTALGDPHRQRIVLMFEEDERLTVGQIVDASPLSRSAVAHHLRVLREAGVLRCEKVGKEVWYWPEPLTVRAALDAVREYLDGQFPAHRASLNDRASDPMHAPNQFDLLKQRRFAPFFWTQFLGAGNDNIFKNAFVVFVAFEAAALTARRRRHARQPRSARSSSCRSCCSRRRRASSPTSTRSRA